MKLPSKLYTGVLLVALLVSSVQVAHAQYDRAFMEDRSVRVVAKGSASSGFLWQKRDWVVTSLHAVSDGSNISVECRGVKRPATVVKTLQTADLVLLSAPGLPEACVPFTAYEDQKPAPWSILYTYGWHAGALSGASRELKKADGRDERLGKLLGPVVAGQIRDFGMPSLNLEIYYVQGGLLPGYSGAPILDLSKQLIGIGAGGLNKGASSFNWIIPAKFLDELVSSTTNQVPPQVATSSHLHFSSGIPNVSEQTTVEYIEDGKTFSWVLTKTQTAAQILKTADAAEGLKKILDVAGRIAGVEETEQLIFDIYEEPNLGLIIAVPEGQPLEYLNDDNGNNDLVSLNKNQDGGFSGVRFQYGKSQAWNEALEPVSADSPEYFNQFIATKLIDCIGPQSICELHEDAVQKISYGENNKLLRFGIIDSDHEGSIQAYDYYTVVTRGDEPLIANAKVFADDSSGLIRCFMDDSQPCDNRPAARKQLLQILSAHLTSFSGLANHPNQKIEQLEFSYDDSWDDPFTDFVPYFEQQQLRFINVRGKEWRVYQGDDYKVAEEVNRSSLGVDLEADETRLRIPVAGGLYFQQAINGSWTPIGTIKPNATQATYTSYYEGADVRFHYDGKTTWGVYAGDGYEVVEEAERVQDIGNGMPLANLKVNGEYFSIPINGGSYYRKTPAGNWVVFGTVRPYTVPPDRIYLEDDEVRFLFDGISAWRMFIGDTYLDAKEWERKSDENDGTQLAVFRMGNAFYKVPINGGKYFKSTPDGKSWQEAGSVKLSELSDSADQ